MDATNRVPKYPPGQPISNFPRWRLWMAAGLAYCLPMGTPATAIAYASGFLKSRDIIVSGVVIMAISWLLFLGSVVFVWPLLGLKI